MSIVGGGEPEMQSERGRLASAGGRWEAEAAGWRREVGSRVREGGRWAEKGEIERGCKLNQGETPRFT